MISYIGILHFGLEFCVFLMCFAISYVSWQLYIRDRLKSMMSYAFGFALIGISGVIHSFNLTGEMYLGIMFIGRIGGYILILWSVAHPRNEGLKFSRNLPIYLFISIPNAVLYWVNAILSAGISYISYRYNQKTPNLFSRNIFISFFLVMVSEILFSFSIEADILWITAHFFKLAGFGIISWSFLKLPHLRIVDKLHVVLRGLVLFSVIITIIPLTIIILFNIQENANTSLDLDIRRISDYMEKDKQRITNMAKVYSDNLLYAGVFDNPQKGMTSDVTRHYRQILEDTGNDFLIIMNRKKEIILQITLQPIGGTYFTNSWLINKATQGMTVTTLEENFITPLDIVCAAPVKTDEKIIGIVITGVHISDNYLENMSKHQQIKIHVFQKEMLIASNQDISPEEHAGFIQNIDKKIFETVIQSKQMYKGELSLFNHPFYAAFVPLYGPQQEVVGILFAGLPADEFENQKSEILAILIIVIIPVTFLAWFVGTQLSRKITQSVYSLSHAAQKISEGDLNAKIQIESSDELADLSRVFNQMIDKLKEIDNTKSDFYSFISHEIRTPLTALRGASETMMEVRGAELKAEDKKMLEIIIQNSQRLSRLVDNLLELAKLEAGKMSFTKVPVDLNQIIQKSVDTFDLMAKEKNIELLNEPVQGLPQPQGDPDWLIQVINNLVSNAIKFTPKNGKVWITSKYIQNPVSDTGIMSQQSMIEVSIHDNGIGIPKTELERVFDKYHQVRNRTLVSDSPVGTGLGLPICKYIIEEMHHGKIRVESEEGKGTVFTFTLYL